MDEEGKRSGAEGGSAGAEICILRAGGALSSKGEGLYFPSSPVRGVDQRWEVGQRGASQSTGPASSSTDLQAPPPEMLDGHDWGGARNLLI